MIQPKFDCPSCGQGVSGPEIKCPCGAYFTVNEETGQIFAAKFEPLPTYSGEDIVCSVCSQILLHEGDWATMNITAQYADLELCVTHYWEQENIRHDTEWEDWLSKDLTAEEITYLEELVSLTSDQPWGHYMEIEGHKLAESEGWFTIETLRDLKSEDRSWLIGSPHNTEEIATFHGYFHPSRANSKFVIEARRFLPRLIEQIKRAK